MRTVLAFCLAAFVIINASCVPVVAPCCCPAGVPEVASTVKPLPAPAPTVGR